MKTEDFSSCTPTRKRLEAQGYTGLSDEQLTSYRFGIRFAYGACVALTAIGLLFTSIPILLLSLSVAFIAVLLPYHPFDYLYNFGLRHVMNRPKLPVRTNQGKFACGIASVWLGVIIYLFAYHQFLWGYVFGSVLLMVGTLVTTTDICIPSMIYNFLFSKQKSKAYQNN
jgi:hypothetical protein